jgi:hypothetical protein
MNIWKREERGSGHESWTEELWRQIWDEQKTYWSEAKGFSVNPLADQRVVDWSRRKRAIRWHDVSQAVIIDLQLDLTARRAKLTVDESISQLLVTVLIQRKKLKSLDQLNALRWFASLKSTVWCSPCSLAQVWLLWSTKKGRKDWENRNWSTKSISRTGLCWRGVMQTRRWLWVRG